MLPPLTCNIFSRHERKLPHLEYRLGEFRFAKGLGHAALNQQSVPYVAAAQSFVAQNSGNGLRIFGLREPLADTECVQSLRALTEEHDLGDWSLLDVGQTHHIDVELWRGTSSIVVGDSTYVIRRSDLFTAAAHIIVADRIRDAIG